LLCKETGKFSVTILILIHDSTKNMQEARGCIHRIHDLAKKAADIRRA
jgi:hypothetical protein